MKHIDQSDWHWWDDSGNIAALLRWLRDGDGIALDEAIYVVEKPWNWEEEWQAMQAAQTRPDLAKCEDEDRDCLVPLLEASVAMARGARRGR
jgi:hypothetical protein